MGRTVIANADGDLRTRKHGKKPGSLIISSAFEEKTEDEISNLGITKSPEGISSVFALTSVIGVDIAILKNF